MPREKDLVSQYYDRLEQQRYQDLDPVSQYHERLEDQHLDWDKESIRKANESNKRNRERLRNMRSSQKFIPTGKVEQGPKPMKPAKPIVDLKGVSSSGAKGASRQQSILTKKATSATPANIWRGMIPMLAKKMSAIGSLLLDPQVPLGGGGQTVTSEQEKKHMEESQMTGPERNYPNPADDSTSDMMRNMGNRMMKLYDNTKLGKKGVWSDWSEKY